MFGSGSASTSTSMSKHTFLCGWLQCHQFINLRAHGSYSVQITDSLVFLNKVVGTRGVYSNKDIVDYLRGIIVSQLATVLGSSLDTIFDMASKFEDLNTMMRASLTADFNGLGISLHDFYLQSISPPDEVQELINQRSGMGAIGNMDEFMKYKVAMSMQDAAKNEGGGMGSMVGAGAGLGMGFAMPGMIQQSMSGATQSESPMDFLLVFQVN